MNLIDRQKLANPNLTYQCPRCGDAYDCSTDDDHFQATVHHLLHVAGDWKRSLWPVANQAPITRVLRAGVTNPVINS